MNTPIDNQPYGRNMDYVENGLGNRGGQPISVIMEQPRKRTALRDWHDGLCACGNNIGNCVLTTLFYPCMVCHMYDRYGENCGVPCVIPMAGMVLNVMHRSRHGIAGSICEDCISFCFCSPCALCRLYRDMSYVEENNGTLD
ncbi:hypothetical protein P879_07414 [Paragonimus westermani]|uniref:Cornifelin n=1 Tax=Paragonimus westermani TaxID=34504 RepID=A0A8T0DBX1_9TREM|nr:hypothetical protein P879_07414 [Paragonimus westermani]